MRTRSARPMKGRRTFVFLAVALLAITAVASSAEAKTYRSKDGHFTITVPADWDQTERTDEVRWEGPGAFLEEPEISVDTLDDRDAKDDANWLLGELRPACDQFTGWTGFTYITRPHTYTNKAGRVGAECMFELDIYGTIYRHRLVAFASDHYNEAYLVQGFGEKATYQQNAGTINTAVDSFRVEGEPFSISAGAVVTLVGLLFIGAAFAAAVTRRRDRRRAAAEARIAFIRQQRGYAPLRPPAQLPAPALFVPANAYLPWGGSPQLYPPEPELAQCPDCAEWMPIGAPACPRCKLEFDWV